MMELGSKFSKGVLEETNIIKNEGVSIMDLCIATANDDELGVFDVEHLIDYIDFKWVKFARPVHFLGFMAHLFYISVLTLYTKGIYIDNNTAHSELYNTMIFFGIGYPAFYDFNQMYR